MLASQKVLNEHSTTLSHVTAAVAINRSGPGPEVVCCRRRLLRTSAVRSTLFSLVNNSLTGPAFSKLSLAGAVGVRFQF
jgi:hypothetical protein